MRLSLCSPGRGAPSKRGAPGACRSAGGWRYPHQPVGEKDQHWVEHCTTVALPKWMATRNIPRSTSRTRPTISARRRVRPCPERKWPQWSLATTAAISTASFQGPSGSRCGWLATAPGLRPLRSPGSCPVMVLILMSSKKWEKGSILVKIGPRNKAHHAMSSKIASNVQV